ncbi:lipocalin family protein [Ascidiimonas aurantiaca]|uniref:lipocalin family protein n=1 Tax=Ascidiimonas aurantiaca TaxID=1685432 RepID=UPI0030EB42E8
MKRNILYVLISLLLVACSGDDDGETREIGGIFNATFDTDKMIGTWTYQTITLNGNESEYEHRSGCPKDIFAFFNSTEKPFEYEEIIYVNNECGARGISLKWEVNQGLINFYSAQRFIIAFQVVSITDSEFIFSYRFDYDEDGDLDEVEIVAVKNNPSDG